VSGAWRLKRFWTETGIEPVEDGFSILLDARPVRTPGKAPLVLPTRRLAEAVAAEWEAQEGEVRPETMPLTRSANSAIDKLSVQREEVAELLAAYAETDLLCYRAEGPEALVARQSEAWDPLLDWAAEALGARLKPVTGVIPAPQDSRSLDLLAERTRALDSFSLAAFHDLVTLTGSLLLAFSVTEGRQDPEAAWLISRVDESWQAEQWGIDEVAAEQEALKKQAFLDAARLFSLLQVV